MWWRHSCPFYRSEQFSGALVCKIDFICQKWIKSTQVWDFITFAMLCKFQLKKLIAAVIMSCSVFLISAYFKPAWYDVLASKVRLNSKIQNNPSSVMEITFVLFPMYSKNGTSNKIPWNVLDVLWALVRCLMLGGMYAQSPC